MHSKSITDNINIVSKKDVEGIDIFIKENTVDEKVFIPVVVSKGGLNDKVYNDFHVGKNANVSILAGCGIHNCTKERSEHSGIHRFYLEENATVKYVENHYGKGTGEKILNPVTEVYLKKDSTLEMQTTQIQGVNSTIRETKGSIGEGATFIVRENIKTHGNQFAKTIFNVTLDGENSSTHLISRAVAVDDSSQEFHSNIVGNAKSYAHSECDAIIEGNGKALANPVVSANSPDAILVHEATIGKIAGEQLQKLMTLGLTNKQAEDVIIKGFLK